MQACGIRLQGFQMRQLLVMININELSKNTQQEQSRSAVSRQVKTLLQVSTCHF